MEAVWQVIVFVVAVVVCAVPLAIQSIGEALDWCHRPMSSFSYGRKSPWKKTLDHRVIKRED